MVEVKIPEEPTKPEVNMRDFRWLFHGDSKTGKTSTASYFENAIFFPTEYGLKGLQTYSISGNDRLDSWKDFCQGAKLVLDTDEFDVVIIDTIEGAFNLLYSAVSNENGVDSIGDVPHGKGYAEANKRMKKLLDDLYAEFGVVLISHTRMDDVYLKGRQITKAFPDLSTSPRSTICGWVDQILYFMVDIEQDEDEGTHFKQHKAQTSASPYVEAGGRLETMPEEILLGDSPKEGFENLESAFQEAAQDFLESLDL